MPEPDIYHFRPGRTPLLVSMPHDGTAIPDSIAARMTELGRSVPDTDWHCARLYGFAAVLGAAVLRPRYSRYVIDLNRPPDGAALYPGAPNTGLCPELSFAGEPLYLPGQEPGADEVAERLERYWRPYHQRLAEALAELRARHGVALLWEAHTIRSRLPRLFEGRLPDLNLGTHRGASCAPALEQALRERLEAATSFSHAVNGRFTGGYITRHYGDPGAGVHAVQLEQAQCTYMEEAPPFRWAEERAARVQPLLRELLGGVLTWAESLRTTTHPSTRPGHPPV